LHQILLFQKIKCEANI